MENKHGEKASSGANLSSFNCTFLMPKDYKKTWQLSMDIIVVIHLIKCIQCSIYTLTYQLGDHEIFSVHLEVLNFLDNHPNAFICTCPQCHTIFKLTTFEWEDQNMEQAAKG